MRAVWHRLAVFGLFTSFGLIVIPIAFADTQGPLSPTAVLSDHQGMIAFSNPEGALTAGGGAASVTLASGQNASLTFHDFNFSIPENAYIDAIDVTVSRRGSSGTGFRLSVFPTPSDGGGGGGYNDISTWPSSFQSHTFVGQDESSILTGECTASAINSPYFYVLLSVDGGTSGGTFEIDAVSVTVHYTPGIGPVPIKPGLVQGPQRPHSAINGPSGDVAFANPEYVQEPNAPAATVALGTYQDAILVASDFGFTIPSDATVRGIEISVKRSGTAQLFSSWIEATLRNAANQLVGGSPLSSRIVPGSPEVLVLGGPEYGDLLTPAVVNNSQFRLFIKVYTTSTGGTFTLDDVTLTAYYSDAHGTLVSSQGARSPGAIVGSAPQPGAAAFTTPEGAMALGGTAAALTMDASHTYGYLTASDFGFSIPTGSAIEGMELQVTRKGPAGALNTTLLASVVTWNNVWASLGLTSVWPTSFETTTFGGPCELPMPNISPFYTAEEINRPDFKVRLEVGDPYGAEVGPFEIDYVALKVYYRAPIGAQGTAIMTATHQSRDVHWSAFDTSAIAASDDSRAQVSLAAGASADDQFIGSLGYSLPLSATITGVEVIVENDSADVSNPVISVALGYGGASITAFRTSASKSATEVFGGEGDLWGLSPGALTPAMVNQGGASGFGAIIGVTNNDTVAHSLSLDQVRVIVHYNNDIPEGVPVESGWTLALLGVLLASAGAYAIRLRSAARPV